MESHTPAGDSTMGSLPDAEQRSTLGNFRAPLDFGELHVHLKRLAHDGATLNTKHALKSSFRAFAIAFLIRWGFTFVKVLATLARQRPFKLMSDISKNNIEKLLLDPAFRQGTASAVRFGQFFGGFTGIFHLARRFLRKTRVLDREEAISFFSGAAGGLAVLFLNPTDWRVLALYMFARLLSCCWNSARQRGLLTPIEFLEDTFGAFSVFGISSAQVMYCYVMRPDVLGSFYNFPLQAGPVSKPMLEAVRCSHRGLPVPWKALQHQQQAADAVARWPADRAIFNARLVSDSSHGVQFASNMPLDLLPVTLFDCCCLVAVIVVGVVVVFVVLDQNTNDSYSGSSDPTTGGPRHLPKRL
eukprot:TRINITY_DN5353_c0_g1_i4.p1 TRINITY_DN5353_c0_g1~~TRINITY_DN5353_c0_g1_i4.p1  ORF type:complete len:357 (-),score=56.22 TRINITY_DN5353_c0_g1_i4:376-1446(-)